MIRKMLVVAAAAAMPLASLALVSTTSSVAGAAGLPITDTVCSSVSGSVNFDPPGLSTNGQLSAVKGTSTTTTGVSSISGCNNLFVTGAVGTTGSLPGNNLVSKYSKCTGAGTPVPECISKQYYFDSTAGFASAGGSTIKKALGKPAFTFEGVALSGKTTVVHEVSCGGVDIGFSLTGTVKSKTPKTAGFFQFVACLHSDSGPGTTGNFLTDLNDNTNTKTIASATIGGSFSSAHISPTAITGEPAGITDLT